MLLEQLCVVSALKSHFSLGNGLPFHLLFPTVKSGFFLETCERWLWVMSQEKFIEETAGRSFEKCVVFQAKEAYEFLLRLTTGLESRMIAETEVFGQFKQNWELCLAKKVKDESFLQLVPWIHRLFEDTKEIRSHYLLDVGGLSYGTTVRKLLKNQSKMRACQQGPVLLIGTGQIAQSIIPFLKEFELWVWNRTEERRHLIYQKIQNDCDFRIKWIEHKKDEESLAWRKAAQIVVCIPVDLKKDEDRVSWFLEGGYSEYRSIIHLGCFSRVGHPWEVLPSFFSLEEVYQLQNSQKNLKSTQIIQAEKVCRERAQLRSLGGSISIPHGWEDLAVFV